MFVQTLAPLVVLCGLELSTVVSPTTRTVHKPVNHSPILLKIAGDLSAHLKTTISVKLRISKLPTTLTCSAAPKESNDATLISPATPGPELLPISGASTSDGVSRAIRERDHVEDRDQLHLREDLKARLSSQLPKLSSMLERRHDDANYPENRSFPHSDAHEPSNPRRILRHIVTRVQIYANVECNVEALH